MIMRELMQLVEMLFKCNIGRNFTILHYSQNRLEV